MKISSSPKPLRDILIDQAEQAYAITEKLFHKVMDADLSWKPDTGQNWMTVGQLLMHCAAYGCGKAVQGFVTGQWDLPDEGKESDIDGHIPPAEAMPAVQSVNEALQLLSEDRELAVRCLKQVKEEDLRSGEITAPWGGPPITLYQQLQLMIAHLAQHKGQLFYYLKLMGHDVDSMDLWVA